MYLRRESARLPASTFQAYPFIQGIAVKLRGPVLLPRLFLWPAKETKASMVDRIIVEHSMVLVNNKVVDKYC